MSIYEIHNGDCLEVLRDIDDNQFDSIVTDPPYGLSFMGKKWDYDVPSVEIWKECLRVLKPGGHLLAFGGTRTYHRLVVNIEDAGFEIRDQIQWIYGSGFPKSQNIALAIDKQLGFESEVVGLKPHSSQNIKGPQKFGSEESKERERLQLEDRTPSSQEGKRWSGWGTALKPANEPICLARKPLSEKTVAKNVLKHGTGGLNVDASRIEASDHAALSKNWNRMQSTAQSEIATALTPKEQIHLSDYNKASLGRFPANILFDEAAAAVLDEQTGDLGKSSGGGGTKVKFGEKGIYGKSKEHTQPDVIGFGDSGGASRFFYVAKASKKDRNFGLEGFPAVESGTKNASGRGFSESDPYKKVMNQNFHPTVKPIKLMEYLIKLVTPEGGIVLDPFMGSGTTGVAALNQGFRFVGIERESKYVSIARSRISSVIKKN